MRDGPLIEVSDLPENITFSILRGEVFGILGYPPQEASQLLQILSGERPFSPGQVRIHGRVGLVRNSIPGFSHRLTVFQNLEFWSVFWKVEGKASVQRVRDAVERVGLASVVSARVSDLNAEQRFRLNVARSLLGEPDVLLFDGFSGGLDPWSAESVRDWVREEWAGKQGKSAVLVSSQVSDMTEGCHRVALLTGRRLAWLGAGGEFSTDRIRP